MRYSTVTTAVLVVVCLPNACLESATAEEIGFAFSGTVFQTFGTPWGFSIPPASHVVGTFVYDTNSSPEDVADSDCDDCHGYRQPITNGFRATFGTVAVRADYYIVEVSNNLPQDDGNPADLMTIRFVSNLSPPLEGPLKVNGTVETDGLFSLNLIGADDMFENSMLPETLEFSDFTQTIGLLDDDPAPKLPDILYSLTGLCKVLPGDYNDNGAVEQNDLDLVLLNWGAPWPPVVTEWINYQPRDGLVDQNDLDRVLLNWGNSSVVAGSTAVPEPSVGLWIVLGVFLTRPIRRARC